MRGRQRALAGPGAAVRRPLVGSLAAVCLVGVIPGRPAAAVSNGIALVSARNDVIVSMSIAEYGVRAAFETNAHRGNLFDAGHQRTRPIVGPGPEPWIEEPVVCYEGGSESEPLAVAYSSYGELWIGDPDWPPTRPLDLDVPGLVPTGQATGLDPSAGCYGIAFQRRVSDGAAERIEIFAWGSLEPGGTVRTRRDTVDRAGGSPNGVSFRPSISVDGRYVAFDSEATDLVTGDTNNMSDVFIRDLRACTTRLVTVEPRTAVAVTSAPW